MNLKIYDHKDGIKYTFSSIPGDKSIAHRALIIGALPRGKYTIKNFPKNEDCIATMECMKKLGISIENSNTTLVVESPGYMNFTKSVAIMDCKNSGTTARLIMGLMSGAGIKGMITGDNSLRERPMKRVTDPLNLMGANIVSTEGKLPIIINSANGKMKAITYDMPVASAQVKSSIIIAGFLSKGETKVVEKIKTRDHTENIFKYLGASISIRGNEIYITNSPINSRDFTIPGDVSSAAFLIALCLLSKNSEITIKNVLLNERRSKYLCILKQMGAKVNWDIYEEQCGENIGDISVKSSVLKAITIEREDTASIIDEVPVISVLAAFSEGTTIIKGVEELKHKESNRIEGIINNLKNIGIQCYYKHDSIIIEGRDHYFSKDINIVTFKDHRIAMAFSAAAIRNSKNTIIEDWEYTSISFPECTNFFKLFLNI